MAPGCTHIGGNIMPKPANMKFMGVREFKEKLTGLLGKKEE